VLDWLLSSISKKFQEVVSRRIALILVLNSVIILKNAMRSRNATLPIDIGIALH